MSSREDRSATPMVRARRFATRLFATRRSRAVGIAALGSVALAGCISFGPDAPEQLLSIAPETSAQVGPATSANVADAIVLIDPEADRSLDVLRVPVRVNAATIAYLQNIAWVEKPAHQFRSLLAETLRTRTSRLIVEDGDFDVAGHTQVTGRLLAMGYDAPTGSVVVRLDMQRQDKGGPVISRRFEAVIPGIPAKAAPVAAALGRASNDVAGQVAAWVIQ
jgi:cholesterol transport system auxiliary component